MSAGDGTLFDLAIVGAGPAGSALALRLARAGARVALIERQPTRTFRVGETLPPAVAPRLQRLGVWEEFLASLPRAADHMLSAWGTPELQSQSFITHPHACGWQIDRARFDALLARAAVDAGAALRAGVRLRALAGDGRSTWRLQLDGGDEPTLRARWLVDATGRSARLATCLGINGVRIDDLVGVALRFTGNCAPWCARPGSMIEATPAGWWYSASLPDETEIAVFLTDADLCRQRGGSLTDFACGRLAAAPHTARRVQAMRPVGPASVWPAASRHPARAAGPGWLAIGDAALARDPLSSSGIDFALATAELAARTLLAAQAGDAGACERYSAAIASDVDAYRSQRSQYYGLERRWPEAPFWARRAPRFALAA